MIRDGDGDGINGDSDNCVVERSRAVFLGDSEPQQLVYKLMQAVRAAMYDL